LGLVSQRRADRTPGAPRPSNSLMAPSPVNTPHGGAAGTLSARIAGTESRSVLIREIREHLTRRSFPRSTMLLIVIASGGCAFLGSAVSLSAGLESMAIRYLLGTATGYGAFIGLIRAWIAYRRRGGLPNLDFVDFVDLPMDLGSRSVSRSVEIESSVDLPDVPLDWDELWPIIVAFLLAIGGGIAILYVVYMAPVLLAEVALDAALVSAVYRRLRRRDAGHWMGTVLRRTWAPAVALALFATLAGFLLQNALPEAQSIGDVYRAFS